MSAEKVIVPSILGTTQEELNTLVDNVKEASSIMQLDVADAKFVPTHSFDIDFTLPEYENIGIIWEAHLMIENPEEWIEKHGDKIDIILPHIETVKDPKAIIDLIKSKGKKAGFALDVPTQVEAIEPFINEIDQVIVFTAEKMGYYGVAHDPKSLEKIKKIRALSSTIDIEVDGAVSPDTIKAMSDAGANKFVVGSYLQKADDVHEAMENLLKRMEG